ncbi:hypothetical protein CENSYa_1102 [Cenarchaeum symbiosum A]|uniref:Uncharacterized protein n=1 Tax=Cenarchaeum symbiosum (strain A) TaxID=414004 RepID=A0RWL4_CENSY|nr:hypothetical protein CENSYa_1102 [Cenarchaeum symbiosum A]
MRFMPVFAKPVLLQLYICVVHHIPRPGRFRCSPRRAFHIPSFRYTHALAKPFAGAGPQVVQNPPDGLTKIRQGSPCLQMLDAGFMPLQASPCPGPGVFGMVPRDRVSSQHQVSMDMIFTECAAVSAWPWSAPGQPASSNPATRGTSPVHILNPGGAPQWNLPLKSPPYRMQQSAAPQKRKKVKN